MNLYIAGGCGEHGRNCFMVSDVSSCFLVDCGIMAEDKEGFPRLSKLQIQNIQCVFLTHSHADHSGALHWLAEQGFKGDVIATDETLGQLPFSVENSVSLESLSTCNKAKYKNICIEWGRSGHCVGSVWYHFFLGNKSILFSGDYTENTQIYAVDEISNRTADLAVLDCAYGKDIRTYEEDCGDFLFTVRENIQQHIPTMLPIPKYGRGLELLKLITDNIPGIRCLGDEHFMSQLGIMKKQKYWFREGSLQENIISVYQENIEYDILFISNPQLKNESEKKLAEEVLLKNGMGIMSGTVEKNTYSYELIQLGKMKMRRYPVHQNYKQYMSLCGKNSFLKTIAYHTSDFDYLYINHLEKSILQGRTCCL